MNDIADTDQDIIGDITVKQNMTQQAHDGQMTSKQRCFNVAITLFQRHLTTMCLLGNNETKLIHVTVNKNVPSDSMEQVG